MKALSGQLLDSIRHGLCDPIGVRRVLAEHPSLRVELAEPPLSISARSVPQWDEFGSAALRTWEGRSFGWLHGWTQSGDLWHGVQIERPEYASFGICNEERVTVDLQEVHGLCAAKSELAEFASMDELVQARCRELIEEISTEQLARLLAHQQIRILNSPWSSDCFARYQWDARGPLLWLINSGGAHHLAAAKYIAARLGVRVPLTGKQYTFSLNKGAIDTLRGDFEMFALGTDPVAFNAFGEAMKAMQATWFSHGLPRPYEHCIAALLPRVEGRARAVADTLRVAGVFDLGRHLAMLAGR